MSAGRSWWRDIQTLSGAQIATGNHEMRFEPPFVLVPDPDDAAAVGFQAGEDGILKSVHNVLLSFGTDAIFRVERQDPARIFPVERQSIDDRCHGLRVA